MKDTEYRILKLRSGEEIIAKKCGQTKDKMILQRPMILMTKFKIDPYSGRQRELTTLKNWLSNTKEIQAKIPKDFIATFLIPENDVVELYSLEKEKEDIDDRLERQILKSNPEDVKNDNDIQNMNKNLEDTLNIMKEQIELNPDFIDEIINGDLLDELNDEKYENDVDEMKNVITLTMFLPPEALIPMVNAGMLNPKDIKKLIDSLSSKDKNDQYLGDDKNRQKEKDFGNDWRDWSSDIEDYF